MIRKLAGILLILSLPSFLSAQQKDKDEYVAIPIEIVLLTTTSPPGCPIQFENARLLMNVQQESYAFSYDVRNVSAKPVAHWEPMFWTSLGTGGTLISEADARKEGQVLLPGEVFRGSSPGLVPLTDELRKRLNLDKASRGLVVLVIKTVVFQDGSRYENSSFVAAVRSNLEQLATDLNRLENITKESEKLKPRSAKERSP
jgi:hypothetical protein